MKRVVVFVASLLCCTSSVFAWNAESFTNGSVYEYEPLMSASTFSLDRGSSLASASSSQSDVTEISLHDACKGSSLQNTVLGAVTGTIKVGNSSYPVTDTITFDFPKLPIDNPSSFRLNWQSSRKSFSSSSSATWESVDIPFGASALYLPITIPSDVSCIQFSGKPRFSLNSGISGQWTDSECMTSAVSLIVNGVNVHTWSPNRSGTIDFGDYIYSGSEVITEIYFRVEYNQVYATSYDYSPSRKYGVDFKLYYSGCTLSFLTGDSVLDGFNDQAQDSINEHESIESQWTGSMTENFNALDMDNFTFPNGLVAAFSLITGIFQDVWNGMGEYKILYVFPLTLAIALLLVGRISKFAGNSGSDRNKGGDDGA